MGCASLLPVVILIITVAFSTFPCQRHTRPKNLPLISEQTRGPVYERPWLRFEYERRLKIAGRILAMFTLGAQVLVSGHRNKMVLCSHIGYPRYKNSLYYPSTRSRPCTRAHTPCPNSGSLKIWRSVQISAQRSKFEHGRNLLRSRETLGPTSRGRGPQATAHENSRILNAKMCHGPLNNVQVS